MLVYIRALEKRLFFAVKLNTNTWRHIHTHTSSQIHAILIRTSKNTGQSSILYLEVIVHVIEKSMMHNVKKKTYIGQYIRHNFHYTMGNHSLYFFILLLFSPHFPFCLVITFWSVRFNILTATYSKLRVSLSKAKRRQFSYRIHFVKMKINKY